MDWSFHSSFSAYRKTEDELGLYRIVYALYLLVFAIPDYTWMSGLPDIFYSPQKMSLGFFFSGFPHEVVLYSFTSLLIISASFLLFGIWSRFFSFLIVVCFVVGNSFAFALGKIDHNFLLWVVPLILGTAWGKSYAVKPEAGSERVRVFGPGVLAFVVAFAMFTAGYIKLMGGWLLPETQAVYGHFIREYYVNQRQELLAGFFMGIENRWLWESMDYGGVMLELLFLPAFFNRRIFRLFLVFTILFHIMNFVMLNIVFTGNYVAYALFIDWRRVKIWAEKMLLHKKLLQVTGILLPLLLLGVLFFGSYAGQSMHFSALNMLGYYFGVSQLMLAGFLLNLTAIAAVLISLKKGAGKTTPDKELAYSHG